MKTHVILGGTGSLGTALTKLLLATNADKVRVLARGEHRLRRMEQELDNPRLSFLIGDVRDTDRLKLALRGATHVYHMAALKHVTTCEYDVLEAVETNVNGSANVVRACLSSPTVQQAVLISTDKAVEPTTAYGSTKHLAERIFIHGNSYCAGGPPAFFCVRYGNVLASQGSVVELWRKQDAAGQPLTITNPAITRFWWTVQDAAKFVQRSMDFGRAGDVLVPLMYSCTLAQLADIIAPRARRTSADGYQSEKLHEVLLAPHEVNRATYVREYPAVRVSYLHDCDERGWDGGQLCSSNAVDAAGVSGLLAGGLA